jgi:fumarylacetoacetase
MTSRYPIDETHAPDLQSWVVSANDPQTDFPVQNLPLGRFRSPGAGHWHIGVAIGDQVLDLEAAGLVDHGDMNRLMSAPIDVRRALRKALSEGLRSSSALEGPWRAALVAQSQIEMGVPCRIGDYTDFYASIHHATTVGKQFRPDNPLLPNYKWVPIGYHGRASSIIASGQSFRRPVGQKRRPTRGANARAGLAVDYELELAASSRRRTSSATAGRSRMPSRTSSESHFQRLSSRDMQGWEYRR